MEDVALGVFPVGKGHAHAEVDGGQVALPLAQHGVDALHLFPDQRLHVVVDAGHDHRVFVGRDAADEVHRAEVVAQHIRHNLGHAVHRLLATGGPCRFVVVHIGQDQRDIALVGVLQQHLVGAVVVQAGQRVVQRLVGELLGGPHLALLVPIGLVAPAVLLLQQEALEFLGGQGLGEVEALNDVAAHGLQREHLLGGLHALGDGGHLEGIGDVDHRVQHLGVLALLEGVVHELHIHLQGVHRQSGDHVQRRIAAAEVVDFDVEARLPQGVDGADDLGGILGIGGLGDLQQELVGAQVKFPDQSLHVVHQVVVEYIHPGHVHRHRHADTQPVLPVPHLGGHLAPDEAVQLADQAVAFEQRYEAARADHAEAGMVPAHQCLGTVEHRHGALYGEFRLVVDQELLLGDGRGKVLQQLLGEDLGAVHLFIVQRHRLGEAVAHRIRGQLGPVEPALDVQRLVHIGVHAHPQPDPAVHAGGGILEDVPVVAPVGTVDQEGIAVAPAHDAAIAGDALQYLAAHPAQHVVAIGLAMALVDHVKMADVHHHGVHVHVLVIDVILVGVIEEEVLVVQAGELVPLGGADDVAVFRQLDHMAHPRQHHPVQIAGLEYKIHGPVVEGVDLVLPIPAHDDDGDALEQRVLGHLLEYGLALGVGQRKVQQYEGEQVLALVHHLQRLRARLRIDDVILPLERVAEEALARRIARHDQYAAL